MPKRLLWAVQLVAAAVVVVMVGRSVAHNWDRFRSAQLTLALRPGWLALSVALLAIVSALQIESWRRILAGWAQSLPYAAAARIWFLANLGRYVPGKVWSVAGMVVMAQREGVQVWAATASTVAVQALGLGTAAALVAATAPNAASPVRLGAGVAAATLTVLALAWKGALPRLARLVGASEEWRALPANAVLTGSVLTLASWIAYGASFWALARGLGLPGLPFGVASGVFALGYVLGLLALFAPGGIGVREAIYISLLTPYVGSGGAIALSVASRLELSITEAAAGLAALGLGNRMRREPVDPARP